jgi:hypothetical protein
VKKRNVSESNHQSLYVYEETGAHEYTWRVAAGVTSIAGSLASNSAATGHASCTRQGRRGQTRSPCVAISPISVNLMSAVFASTDKVEPSDSGSGSQADKRSSQTPVFAFKVADEARPCEHR